MAIAIDSTNQAPGIECLVVREHQRVCDLLGAQFPMLGAADREMVVDGAWDYAYAEGQGKLVGSESALRALWINKARWLATDRVRSRQRRGAPASVEEHTSDEGRSLDRALQSADRAAEDAEARESRSRIQELLRSLSAEERELALRMYASECATAHSLAGEMATSERHVKYVLKQLRAHVREHVAARERGDLCRQADNRLDEYIAWSIETRAAGAGLTAEPAPERFADLWLHHDGCPSCRARARAVHTVEGRIEHALAPPLLVGAGIAARLTRLAHSVHVRAVETLQTIVPARIRAGSAGGGLGALLGLTGKTAAVCITLVCAATGGIVIGGALRTDGAQHTHHTAASAHAPQAITSILAPAPAPAATAPATPAPQQQHGPASQRSHGISAWPQAHRVAALPAAALPTPEAPSAGATATAPTSARNGCTAPGDLGCIE
ncbi:MAG: RNA polymerase sigma factor [Solirubrobacteraceae bacterium]